MSTLAFELRPALEAGEPPEARGLRRDDVRLMVAERCTGTLIHARFRELPTWLGPGDLIVINNSATLPAAVPGTRSDGMTIEVRFATRAHGHEPDRHVVELAQRRRYLAAVGRRSRRGHQTAGRRRGEAARPLCRPGDGCGSLKRRE